jgi:hypothetical protein
MTTITDDAQLEEAQEIIDIAAGKTVLGTDTRTNALRTALKQLNANGITGFYDRTGRSWSAEAYVNMDIRTTVHNTYIQSVKTRQEDYGSDVFQVSSHAGARPLCYPYQGKLYSWGDSGGRITLGDGQTYRFESIKTTSYGEPAGLFGINCGHVPYPMIPRVSEKVEEEIQPKEENDREYQESQQQRSLERAIRYQKRELEMLGNNATQADKEKLKQAQARMREFIKETGRTRRYDREQIVTESNSKNQIHVKGVNAVEIYPSDKISKESVSEIKNAINNTGARYRIKLNAVTQMSDKQSLDNPLTPAITNSLTHVLEYNPLYFKDKATLAKTAKAQSEAGEWVKVAEDDYARYIAVHESKHLILGVRSTLQTSADKQTNEYLAASEIAELFKQYKTTSSRLSAIIKETGDPSVKAELERIKISNRSYVNEDEFMAEGATKADIGLTTNEYTDKIVEILDRYMRND